jgi:DNA-binding response OmpR family regulator
MIPEEEPQAKRILVVDDVPSVIRLLQLELTIQGFKVEGVEVNKALDALKDGLPDLVLLEVLLPGISGYELLEAMKGQYPGLPVVFLTTEHSEAERALAFDLGADDYITKPFDPEELGRRVSALLQQPTSPRKVITSGPLTIDLTRKLARRGDVVLSLTLNEWAVLLTLAANPRKRIRSEELLLSVWGAGHTGHEALLTPIITRLRQRLDPDPSRPSLIIGDLESGFSLDADISSEPRR